MQRKDPLVEGEIYHVFNRGVEKRDIFSNDHDRLRFIDGFTEFNSNSPTEHIYYRQNLSEVGPRKDSQRAESKEKLVDILAFTLLPNHFHLLLRQNTEGGITTFMRKLGTGYTMYFNKKYERVGPLFQGKFKSSLIDREEYFLYIPHYIHLNVLDVLTQDKQTAPDNHTTDELLDMIKTYRWSSAGDFLGAPRYQEIINCSISTELFGSSKEQEVALRELLSNSEVRPPNMFELG